MEDSTLSNLAVSLRALIKFRPSKPEHEKYSPYTGSYDGVHVNVDPKLANFINHSNPKEELIHRSIAVKLEEKIFGSNKRYFFATLDDEVETQAFPSINWSDHPGPLLIDGHNLFYHLLNSVWPEQGYVDIIDIIKAVQAHCQPVETIFYCCWDSLKQHQQFQSNLEDLELITTVANIPIKQVRSGGRELKIKTDIDHIMLGGIHKQCYKSDHQSLSILAGDCHYHQALLDYQEHNPGKPIRIIAPDGSLSNELLLMGNEPLVETTFLGAVANIPAIIRANRLRNTLRRLNDQRTAARTYGERLRMARQLQS